MLNMQLLKLVIMLLVYFGIKINIKNEKYLQNLPAIVVANHQSALDIYVLGKFFNRVILLLVKIF